MVEMTINLFALTWIKGWHCYHFCSVLCININLHYSQCHWPPIRVQNCGSLLVKSLLPGIVMMGISTLTVASWQTPHFTIYWLLLEFSAIWAPHTPQHREAEPTTGTAQYGGGASPWYGGADGTSGGKKAWIRWERKRENIRQILYNNYKRYYNDKFPFQCLANNLHIFILRVFNF